jgi:hypothetical protein
MKKKLFILLMFLPVFGFGQCDSINAYISDTTMQAWSQKFNCAIKNFVGNDTIVLGVDNYHTWVNKINTYVSLASDDTLLWGVDSFEGYRTKFNSIIALSTPNLYIGDSVLNGNDATMNGSNNWVTGLVGGLNPDMTTNPGYMTLEFTSGNQAVKIDNGDFTGIGDTRIYLRVKRVAGPTQTLHVGRRFASTVDDLSDFEITPTEEWGIYIYTLRGTSSDIFWIGDAIADNFGSTFLIDYCHVFEVNNTTETNEQSVFSLIPKVMNGGRMIDSLQAFTRTCAKIGIVGNSIMANYYGGVIPSYYDEGEEGERPPRLTTNNIARRIYDTLFSLAPTFNKAFYRRIDHVNWSLTGSWTDTTGSGVLTPAYTASGYETNYSYTATASATAEINIPDGYENAAIIYHKAKGYYGATYDDSVYVQLNSGSIAAYGDTIINTFRNTQANFPDGLYQITEYNNLPSGANTITITKDNNTDNLVMWGIAYWTGKTIMVLNYARGGRSMYEMWTEGLREVGRLHNEFSYRQFDFAIIENPGMNEAGNAYTLNYQQAYYENMLNIFKSIPHVVVTTHPFGCNPGCSTNYYTLYNSPFDLERRYNRSYNYSYYDGLETYNIFRDFKSDLNNRGYSLIDGQAGLDWTTDGQHPNETCAEKWMQFLINNILK